MVISFVVPFLAVTGGIRSVFEIANGLIDRGHKVRIIYPRKSVYSRRNEILRKLKFMRNVIGTHRFDALFRTNRSELNWFDLQAQILEVPDLEDKYIPKNDVIIATAWRTADAVSQFSIEKGVKYYYIQHYEVWSGPKRKVDATWRAPMKRIASSAWIAQLAKQHFGIDDIVVIPYGINPKMFYNSDPKKLNRPLRIGMMYHKSRWKGCDDALKALKLVRKNRRDIQIVMFSIFPKDRRVPDDVEYHFRPSQEELRKIYCSLDIFLCASWSETGPMTIPEAMACKAAVVTTDVGNVRLWTDNGRLAFISPPGDVFALVRNLETLISNPDMIVSYGERGSRFIEKFTWEKVVADFEQVLLD